MFRRFSLLALPLLLMAVNADAQVQVVRFDDNPLLAVTAAPGLEENVNGPSVIRVPDWVEEPLGRYYLYFAHHQGHYIRLAYADGPEGPFTVYEPGTLRLEESGFPTQPPDPETLPPERRRSVEEGREILPYAHIASPDVHVVPEHQEIRMYFHGLNEDGRQLTKVAVSRDGIHFEAGDELLGRPYFRVFRYQNMWYAMAMPGVFYRSMDGLTDFEQGPMLFDVDMRHSAVLLRGDTLHVLYTRAGDAPERILHSAVTLGPDWNRWSRTEPTLVLKPETAWEGAELPVVPSARGAILRRANQLRDPALLEDDGQVFLYYAIAGEHGIAGARVVSGF
jgi:hypothetical protein